MLRKCFVLKVNLLNKCLLRSYPVTCFNSGILKYYHGFNKLHSHLPLTNRELTKQCCVSLLLPSHRKWCSKRLLDGEVEIKEFKKIKELFPDPRHTLNNLTSKTPQKIFDMHFKQYVVPKIGKRKIQNLDWTCTYTFIWPEKMKFESTAVSKRQAAEKAALDALHWLYTIKKIDNKGCPIYDKEVLQGLSSNLNEPYKAHVSEKAIERVEKIWNEYENGIKDIFVKTIQEANWNPVSTVPVINKDSTIDEEELTDSEEYGEELEGISEPSQLIHPVYGKVVTAPTRQTLDRRDTTLKRKFEAYNRSITELPIDQYSDQITSTLETNRVSVIIGAAGCGKSTRVPPTLLRHCGVNANIVVTEPRRVAAIGLAERVASELSEEVGETVGYHVRLHAKPPRPPAGSILYCTSGVLLSRLQKNPGLTGCSHVIIDEAHERDVNTDVTMLLLKKAMELNPDLKIVIMSATLDSEVFTRYFNACPVIEVPGRTFPVDILYLDDIEKKYDLKLTNSRENSDKEDGRPSLNIPEIVETIKAIDKREKEGAILVFLPGWAEIKHAKVLLDECYANSGTHMILPVHSRLSATDQSKMFGVPPPGIRKIVLATNVAETSVTVPDVVYTLDCGAHKQNVLKEGTGMASLDTVWVSLASAKQRCGRAGRVQPGVCYRMYTKEKEAEFEPHNTPEILRIPLEQTVLDCKSYAPDVKAQDFLSQLPEPPTENAIKYAVKELIEMGALSQSEQITRLGTLISRIPAWPRASLALLHSAILGTSVALANIIAHIDTNVEVFYNAGDRKSEIREIKRKFSPVSDHVALHWIQQEFERELEETSWNEVDEWCNKYQLKKERLGFVKSLSSLYLQHLLKSGIVEYNLESDEVNRFSDIDELVMFTLLCGLDKILVTKKYVKTKGKLKTVNGLFMSTGERAHISTASVNKNLDTQRCILVPGNTAHCRVRRAILVYSSSKPAIHSALLTNNRMERNDIDDNTTVLRIPKHNLDVQVPTSQADTFIKLKEMLQHMFQYYINRDIQKLEYNDYEKVSKFKSRLVKILGRVLVEANYKDSVVE